VRILLSAIACNPDRGSEAHFGWAVVKALAPTHEVHVIGHGNDRRAIECAQLEGRVSSAVKFHYLGGWTSRHKNRIIARIQNWLDFHWWSRATLPLARELHAQVGFEVVHHVTLSSWRVPTPLWRLGVPLIWGPLGGAEKFPLRLMPTLGANSALYELFRRLQGMVSVANPRVRKCARHSACLVASNRETATLLQSLSGGLHKPCLLSAAFFSPEQMSRLRFDGRKASHATLRLFAGGDVEGRKGIALALRALSILKKKGIPFHYHVGGRGPETEHLRRLAEKLGVSDQVTIGVPLSGDAYVRGLKEADVYLLPSLRDNSPVTLMEAMLAGCVPIVADCGGPGLIVGEGCGYRIPVSSADQMVFEMAGVLQDLHHNREMMAQTGRKASLHIVEHYSEKIYLERILELYGHVRRGLI
jgi:glycosyltransferase involved in cell wall biosynthesis